MDVDDLLVGLIAEIKGSLKENAESDTNDEVKLFQDLGKIFIKRYYYPSIWKPETKNSLTLEPTLLYFETQTKINILFNVSSGLCFAFLENFTHKLFLLLSSRRTRN